MPAKSDLLDTARDIVQAIIAGDDKVIEQALNPDFRFTTKLDPDFGASLSEAFAVLLARARSKTTTSGRAISIERRTNKADEYAVKVFDELEKIKSENDGVLTLQKAAELLTERGIKTPTGKGKWHSATLVPLQKRWQKLGLTHDKPKP